MAATTTVASLTSAGYTALATSAASGVVQLKSGGRVRIHVGQSLPAVGIAHYLTLGTEGDLFRSFSWTGFTTGDIVYGRAEDADASVTTIVP